MDKRIIKPLQNTLFKFKAAKALWTPKQVLIINFKE